MTILRILLRRLGQAVLVSLLIGTLSFFMVRALPGDLAMRVAAGRYGYDLVTTASAAQVRSELRLDRPAPQALAAWLGDVARLQLGTSWVSKRPVIEEVASSLQYTVTLAGVSMALALMMGISLGVWACMSRRRWIDHTLLVLAAAVRSIPPFVLGLLLIITFAVQFNSLPAAGPEGSVGIILPALTLAASLAAGIGRVTRETMTAVTQSEYFSFALTKGLSRHVAILRHAIRNCATPVVSYTSVQLAFLIEGVVIVETLFAWPGLGHAMVHAIFGRDVPVIEGTVLALSLFFILLSTAVDLLMVAVDPRAR
jgi:peptide/nickel transport system permease protein